MFLCTPYIFADLDNSSISNHDISESIDVARNTPEINQNNRHRLSVCSNTSTPGILSDSIPVLRKFKYSTYYVAKAKPFEL